MEWLHNFLFRFAFYRRFIDWTKTLIIPGFRPLPLYTVVVFFILEIKQGALGNRASSLAYSFMLAIFPALIFLVSLIPFIPLIIPYIPEYKFQRELLSIFKLILPDDAFQAFKVTLVDLVKNRNGKLLSFGFFSALYFATNGISNLMRAFNKSSLQLETRSWLKRRWTAILLTLVLSFAMFFAIILMIAGQSFISFLQEHIYSKSNFWSYVIAFSRWIVIVIIFFVTLGVLYRYGPAHKQRWKFINPGSVLATFLGLLISIGFAYYINNFSAYNKVYGSIGTLIVVMIWMYLNSLVVLIGFELNASVDLSKRNIKISKPLFNTFRTTINRPNEN
ncbi:YihY/virulence factor BrkB family protein [Mucilaginibacter sp. JRF]|uniref:YihY/virulence factor BrkB family protein n=1 Tax=Mucilaginibacter sp. JRF TaxID=2780088 RepID=UPI00187DF263|nr:YihY/virulence factor BrkB family protein [Mucilaginibacter sp. JRF]MBE9585929.1 YihY/virulence factor BrkB family protein [Mucilaginibacter sp. JRF]